MSDLAVGFAILAALLLLGVFLIQHVLRGRFATANRRRFVGGAIGFVMGAACGLLGFYIFFMAPQGQPFDLIGTFSDVRGRPTSLR